MSKTKAITMTAGQWLSLASHLNDHAAGDLARNIESEAGALVGNELMTKTFLPEKHDELVEIVEALGLIIFEAPAEGGEEKVGEADQGKEAKADAKAEADAEADLKDREEPEQTEAGLTGFKPAAGKKPGRG